VAAAEVDHLIAPYYGGLLSAIDHLSEAWFGANLLVNYQIHHLRRQELKNVASSHSLSYLFAVARSDSCLTPTIPMHHQFQCTTNSNAPPIPMHHQFQCTTNSNASLITMIIYLSFLPGT